MTLDLEVLGQGAVSPAGVGVDALLHRSPTVSAVNPLGRPEQTWPVLRVDLKDPALQRWQREPRLRRASSITYFLVEAASQALGQLDAAARAQTGLIVAYSAGCLLYSRRFFEGIIRQGQRTASPALFPETVFNSPVSHVATVLKLNGAAYALVGDETAWIAALKTAHVWLAQDRVRHVLVLGAEEFDPLALDAYESVRWLRRRAPSAFLAAEGAAGLLISKRTGTGPGITRAGDGLIYRTRREALTAAKKLVKEIGSDLPCFPSAARNWLAEVETAALQKRNLAPVREPPYLGEAFTASAAWNTVRALSLLSPSRPSLAQPVWGLNHQLGWLELRAGA